MKDNKDYIASIDGAERRFFMSASSVENRADDTTEVSMIQGYGALFNSRTNIAGLWEEEILPGFFDGVLDDDVRALFNHDPNQICARSKSGTLRLWVDEKGLNYSFPVNDRSYVRDLASAIADGDVSESSFAFSVSEEKWIEREGDIPLRQLVRAKKLYDVSPVTYPAYPDTSVGARSLQAEKDQNTNQPQNENEERKTAFDAQIIINQNT